MGEMTKEGVELWFESNGYELLRKLKWIADYEPREVCKDDFAYDRIVAWYKENISTAIRAAADQSGDQSPPRDSHGERSVALPADPRPERRVAQRRVDTRKRTFPLGMDKRESTDRRKTTQQAPDTARSGTQILNVEADIRAGAEESGPPSDGRNASSAKAVCDEREVERANPAVAALPQEEGRETAWLIERGQLEQQYPTIWWVGGKDQSGIVYAGRWTETATKAKRFPTKEAAEAEKEQYDNGHATEHVFIGAER